MKSIIDNYNRLGIIVSPDGISQSDRNLIANDFYHLSFHVKNSIRELRYINDASLFQAELYEGSGRLPLITYYRNHIFNLLSNIGMICNGIRAINTIQCANNLLSCKLNKDARNTANHIFERIYRLNEQQLPINGFNIIENNDDKDIERIDKPVLTLNLISKQLIVIIRVEKSEELSLDKIDLLQLEKELYTLMIEVDHISSYIQKAWYSWH